MHPDPAWLPWLPWVPWMLVVPSIGCLAWGYVLGRVKGREETEAADWRCRCLAAALREERERRAGTGRCRCPGDAPPLP